MAATRTPSGPWRGNTNAGCSFTTALHYRRTEGARTPRLSWPDAALWKELFTNPQYRSRTWVLIVCWLAGYASLIYGALAHSFPVYMVDHGGTAHEVFLTLRGGLWRKICVAFQVNARLGERVERRDVIAVMATLVRGELGIVAWLVQSLSVIAASCYIVSRIGTGLFLFNLYNLHGGGLSDAHPRHGVRLDRRSGASRRLGWRDPAWPALVAWGPNHLGWILWIVIPGALLPAILIRGFGIRAIAGGTGAGVNLAASARHTWRGRMVAIKSVAHFSIPVSDTAQSTQFYTEIVGCRHLATVGATNGFLHAAGTCLILLKRDPPINPVPEDHGGVHHSFAVAHEEYPAALDHLRATASKSPTRRTVRAES